VGFAAGDGDMLATTGDAALAGDAAGAVVGGEPVVGLAATGVGGLG